MKQILIIILVIFFKMPLLAQESDVFPCVTLCYAYNNSLTINETINCGKLIATDTNYIVHSFFMETSIDSSWLISPNSLLTEPMICRIKKLKKDDKIVFDQIKIANKNGNIIKACSFAIKIK